MAKQVAVVVLDDPYKTGRPVEALRIALGLYAGGHKTTVVLLNLTSCLLSDDIDDVLDIEILEKYLPSFKQLSIPFMMEFGVKTTTWSNTFTITKHTQEEIRMFIQQVDRCLIF